MRRKRTRFFGVPNSDRQEPDRRFVVTLEPQLGGGFTVLVPALAEVVTEGETEAEALANAREAVRAILEFRKDRQLPIPSRFP